MGEPDERGIGAAVDRAVVLYARGEHEQAFSHLDGAVMGERFDALRAAMGLAMLLIEEAPPGSWEITGLPIVRYRRVVPLVSQFVALTRGKNFGGLHQMWGQLPSPVAADVLATLLAMAGAAACHPEWN
jgi:hypothetical protein